MKLSIIRATGLAILLSSNLLASGTSQKDAHQLSDEYERSKKAITEEYVRSRTSLTPDRSGAYTSPDIFEDSLARKAQSYEGTDAGFESGESSVISPDSGIRTILAPEPDTLKIFGFDMFTDRSVGFSPPEIAAAPPDYSIGPGDNLIINMWGRVDKEFNLTVNREGKVFIPRVGDVICYGLSLDDLETRLKKRFSEIYSEFNLSVTLGKIRSISVYVYGEVKQPGRYTLSSLSTLFNGLYSASGPNARGSMRKIRLLRGGNTIQTVDLYRFLLFGDSSGDIKLESEDVIFVPLAGDLVKVYGEVRRPAIYELLGGETIDEVVDLAGGMTPGAYASKVAVDRIGKNDDRIALDVDLSNASVDNSQFAMRGGDVVTIHPKDSLRVNIVWLDGHVKHPGAFQIEMHSIVSELISNGDQLYEDAYMERADLIRTHPNGSKEIIPINLSRITGGQDSVEIVLQAKDSLIVYATSDVTRDKYVWIKGEVAHPGRYRLLENMKLSDLIFRAGNLNRNAYLLSAEIARMTDQGETELFHVSLDKLIEDSDQTYDVALAEDDQVFIRKMPAWDENRIVAIQGEVRFPGEYILSHDGESLYQLIHRAGGLTEKAFPAGAVFTRAQIADDLRRQNISDIITKSAPLKEDSTGRIYRELAFDVNTEKMNRIVIDLDLILNNNGMSKYLPLRPGDQIYIPRMPSGVQVMGAIASSGTIQFETGKKPSYYIDRAGGLLRNSDKNSIRVVKADGRVLNWSKARGKATDLGDAIVVPTQIKRQRDWWKILTSTATIVGGLATTVYIVDKL